VPHPFLRLPSASRAGTQSRVSKALFYRPFRSVLPLPQVHSCRVLRFFFRGTPFSWASVHTLFRPHHQKQNKALFSSSFRVAPRLGGRRTRSGTPPSPPFKGLRKGSRLFVLLRAGASSGPLVPGVPRPRRKSELFAPLVSVFFRDFPPRVPRVLPPDLYFPGNSFFSFVTRSVSFGTNLSLSSSLPLLVFSLCAYQPLLTSGFRSNSCRPPPVTLSCV